jgi:excisionase family DNA binding protein
MRPAVVPTRPQSAPRLSRLTPFTELPELLTPVEFATVSGMSKGIVYDLVRRGALRHVRFGKLIRIRREALREPTAR